MSRGLCESFEDERGLVGVHFLRVRYAETDQMGVAYHGSYVPWLEEGRTEWMRLKGRTYRSLEDEGMALAVVNLNLSYRSPLRYDDLIRIETWLHETRRVAVELRYKLARKEEGGELVHAADATTTLAFLGTNGRPARIPEGLFV